MKTVGFIAEYNPFHNGHLYHLNQSKKITDANYSVCVMSGNFVQRGEPSIIDKWTKAKMAVDNGIDLIIELPIVYSIQSAEIFAYGSMSLLNLLGIIDYVAFGSEIGEIKILDDFANIFNAEPPLYKKFLKKHLNEGYSFPQSRNYALKKYLKEINREEYNIVDDILKSSNNILAIEYLKALKKLNSDIIPITFKRIGSEHNKKNLDGNLSSASSIRNQLLNENIKSIKNTVPDITFQYLNEFYSKYGKFNSMENYSDILKYVLRNTDTDKIAKIMDVETGLENRIKKSSYSFNNEKDIINSIATKRYTLTRIQRIMIHLLLDLKENDFKKLNLYGPRYIRILGTNEKGFYLINKIKQKSVLPIITKFTDCLKYNDPSLLKMIDFDKKGTDLFFLPLEKKDMILTNLDYYTSPYIYISF